MQSSNLGWEAEFISHLRMRLDAVIPISTLIVKILVRVFTREDFEEVVRSVVNLPLELLLIAMSFMFGALCGISPNYVTKFEGQGSADLFAAFALVCLFGGCLVVNLALRFLKVVAGKLYVAFKQYRELMKEPVIPGTVNKISTGGRLVWGMVYCILMVVLLLFSFGSSVLTLAYVLHLIQ
jgi:hypothetical protein